MFASSTFSDKLRGAVHHIYLSFDVCKWSFVNLSFGLTCHEHLCLTYRYVMHVVKVVELSYGAANIAHLLLMKVVSHVRRSQLSSTTSQAGPYVGDMARI